MPVFFVDISVGDALVEDLEGIELADLQAAEAHCIAGLIEVARSLVAADVRQRITSTLRDEARNLLVKRTVTVTCELH